MLFTLREVGSLIDSIDANRNALRVRVVEGTTLLSYQERLMEVNEYVKRSEEKLKDLRSALQAANTESEAYLMMVSSLQDELSISSDEIQRLDARVSKLIADKSDLKQTVKIQKTTLEDFQFQLDAKYEELKLFELRIQELTKDLQITEADAYYAQAQALELAARRTRLAPKKKKDTYRQAMELYKKALEAGNTLARDRINSLQEFI
jgi:chromosome segregation ATPase